MLRVRAEDAASLVRTCGRRRCRRMGLETVDGSPRDAHLAVNHHLLLEVETSSSGSSRPQGEWWPVGMPFPVCGACRSRSAGMPFPVVATNSRTATTCFCSTRASDRRPDIDEELSPERVPLPDAPAEHCISMADVTAVANCHLHVDQRRAERPVPEASDLRAAP